MAALPDDIMSLLRGRVPQMPGGFANDDEASGLPGEDIEVQFEEAADPTFALDADGNVSEVFPDEDEIAAASPPGHMANLAETIEDDELDRLAASLIEDVEDDIEAREPHMARFKRGLQLMGLQTDTMDDGPFPGASSVTHPLISEAIVQFWARAMGELVPAEGPAKGKVNGRQHKAMLDRADRVAAYINHELLFSDDSWYSDHSRATFAIPFAGDAFKKVYRDPVLGENVSIYVPAEDFIVPYNSTDLRTTPRFTHRIWRSKNELKRAQAAGVYRNVELIPPESEDHTEALSARIEVQDLEPGDSDGDARHELFEVNVELNLVGHEDPKGIALPYIVTIDKGSSRVLSIYRGWKAKDQLRRRRVQWVKYTFIPGLGFYGLGLFHLIGGLQEAATGALRALLDGAATSSLQGGFVAKDANMSGKRLEIEPGVWQPVDATSEDLNKAFFTPPFKEPSAQLTNVLGMIVEAGQKFSATTEAQTGGQSSQNAPVGSTLAIIEQGQKVFSTVHRGMHMAMGAELRLRYELVQEYMPEGGYPYDVDGNHEGILAEDFAPGISITPVSDPNIHSSAQRVAIAQITYDLALANPDIIKRPVAVRRVLEAARVPDIDELMVSNEPPPPMDPVSEVQALLRGEPVQAYPDQPHEFHLAHLTAFIQNPGYGGNPEVMKQIGPAVMALMGQRLAYQWATHVRAQGVPAQLLPPPMQAEGAEDQQGPMDAMNGAGGPMIDQSGQPIAPPELIAQLSAQIAPMMAQVPGLPMPADPAAQKAAADAEDKKAEREFKMTESRAQADDRAQDRILKNRELDMKEKESAAKEQAAMAEAQMKAQAHALDEQRKAEEYEKKKLAEDFKMAAESEKVQRDRDAHVKQSMHDDAVRERDMAKKDAEVYAASIEAQRKENEIANQDNERTSTNDQLVQMISVMDGLAKAMRAPKKIIRDPVTNKAIGAVSVDIDAQPEQSSPRTRRKSKPNGDDAT